MSILRHEFEPEALAEYEEAVRHYAEQQAELGLRFIASIEDSINRICEAPDRWRVLAGREVRRAFAQVFPYSILYTVESAHVLIVAVAHHSRKPGYWHHRLM